MGSRRRRRLLRIIWGDDRGDDLDLLQRGAAIRAGEFVDMFEDPSVHGFLANRADGFGHGHGFSPLKYCGLSTTNSAMAVVPFRGLKRYSRIQPIHLSSHS